MPENTVLINDCLKYYLDDSGVDGLLEYLNTHGTEQKSGESTGKTKGAKTEEVKKDEA